jgi:dihydrofolate reductase
MPKLCVRNFSISLDGYSASPNQSLEHPFGELDPPLHEWMLATRFGRQMMGEEGGSVGLDNVIGVRIFEDIGASIMGRNMFGPIRGEWENDDWTGWWGPNPPYHHQVFVLTHHPRASITMEGGTTFHFVDDGIEAAHARAFEAADGKDVLINGGASTIQQFLRAGLVDEMRLVISPIFVGAGERLFDHLDGGPHGYEVAEMVSSPAATHVLVTKAM